MADIVCISLSYLLLFHYYYCLAGTKNDKTILAGKSIHLSFCGLLYSQDILNLRTCLHSCLKADDVLIQIYISGLGPIHITDYGLPERK